MTEFFNRSVDEEKRRALRREMPPAERLLWARLQTRQLCGWKFRRQYGVGPYILDFYCLALSLAVELDGGSHDSDEAQAYDRVREEYLQTFRIRVIRFANEEVFSNIEAVINGIVQAGKENLP